MIKEKENNLEAIGNALALRGETRLSKHMVETAKASRFSRIREKLASVKNKEKEISDELIIGASALILSSFQKNDGIKKALVDMSTPLLSGLFSKYFENDSSK